MIYIALASLLVFVLYLFFVLKKIGHLPKSLSETYYYLGSNFVYPREGWNDNFNRLKASIFTFALWVMAFLLLPVMISKTPESLQFLTFLAIAGICFVGAAPEFKDSFEGKVHSTSAIISAVFGILWATVVIGAAGRIALGVSVFVVLAVALMTDSLKSSRTFWLELVAFATVYLSVLFSLL